MVSEQFCTTCFAGSRDTQQRFGIRLDRGRGKVMDQKREQDLLLTFGQQPLEGVQVDLHFPLFEQPSAGRFGPGGRGPVLRELGRNGRGKRGCSCSVENLTFPTRMSNRHV
jgi:hypothetical protein